MNNTDTGEDTNGVYGTGDNLGLPDAITSLLKERISKRISKVTIQPDSTRMRPLQPLNTIGGESNTGSPPDTNQSDDLDGLYEPVELICEQCQIYDIIETCKHCGIWQYCINHKLFDLNVRRRQNGTSAESSDAESDS